MIYAVFTKWKENHTCQRKKLNIKKHAQSKLFDFCVWICFLLVLVQKFTIY